MNKENIMKDGHVCTIRKKESDFEDDIPLISGILRMRKRSKHIVYCVLHKLCRVADPEQADIVAEHGLLLLQESAIVILHPELDWSLLDSWSERKLAIQRL